MKTWVTLLMFCRDCTTIAVEDVRRNVMANVFLQKSLRFVLSPALPAVSYQPLPHHDGVPRLL